MSAREMTEVAATNGHGALDCEIDGCEASLTLPVRGTRRGVPTSWRLCRFHGAQMVGHLLTQGETVTHDGWAPPAPVTPAPPRPRHLPAPTPTPTPEEHVLLEETPMTVARVRPTCSVPGCSADHLAHRLCVKHLSRARTRGIVLTAGVTPEQIEIILAPHANKGGGSKGRAATPAASPEAFRNADTKEFESRRAFAASLDVSQRHTEAAPDAPAAPPAGSAAFWEAEAGGFEARLNAVNAALDAAGVDPYDALDEGPAVHSLVVQLSELRDLVSSIREALGLLEEHDDAEVLAEVERLVEMQKPPALAAADAFRHRVAEAVIGRAVEDVPYDDDGLLVALQDALFTVAQRQEMLLTPEDLRARVAELDAAEEAAEEADQLEERAKRLREEAAARRVRALGAPSAAA